MNVKHTPGPYEVGKFWPAKERQQLSSADITPCGELAILAKVYRPDQSKKEGEANARLFAAAPDMFKALIAIDHFLWKEGYTTTSPEIAQVCAAITKAKETQ